MSHCDISNTSDIIDSRDVIARIAELESDLQSEYDDIEGEEFVVGSAYEDNEGEAVKIKPSFEEWVELQKEDAASASHDEAKEYAILAKLAEDGANSAEDWQYGATLIRESYFEKYCRELVSDIGDLPTYLPDYLVIDWDETADNLRVDYTEVAYDGVTYLVC